VYIRVLSRLEAVEEKGGNPKREIFTMGEKKKKKEAAREHLNEDVDNVTNYFPTVARPCLILYVASIFTPV
jgi:hypothetical protein